MKQRTAKKIRSKKDTICCKTQGEGEKIFRPLILKTGGKIYMKLVIAEKPSVALSISKIIGAKNKKDGYYEGNGYRVSWCVGHLIQMANPDAYDEKYAKWKIDDLPIIPKECDAVVDDNNLTHSGPPLIRVMLCVGICLIDG